MRISAGKVGRATQPVMEDGPSVFLAGACTALDSRDGARLLSFKLTLNRKRLYGCLL